MSLNTFMELDTMNQQVGYKICPLGGVRDKDINRDTIIVVLA